MKKMDKTGTKIITSLAMICMVMGNIWGQVSNYTFSETTGTYTAITGGTSLVSCNGCGTAYDNNTYGISLPVGSQFPFNGTNITAVTMLVDGSLILGTNTGTSSTGPISSTQAAIGIIAALGMDLRNTTLASQNWELRWEDVGSEVVFQWTNASRWSQNTVERFSFQIIINETTGVINIVYGNMTTIATSTTYQPQVGLRGSSSTDYNARRLTTTIPDASPNWGAPSGTTAATSNSHTCRFTSTSTCVPSSGLIYTWTPPSCVSPTLTATTSITTTTASINWSAASPAPSGGYQYEIRTSGAAGSGASGLTASGTVGAGILTAAISGLTSGTSYSVYVRSDCGSSTYSSWTSAGTFKTLCNTITTLPFVENFESSSTTLGCWSVVDGNSDGDMWATSTTNPRGGTQCYRTYSDYNTSNQDYLISPKITLTGNQQLKFWTRAHSTAEPDEISIKVSTSGNAISNFTSTALASTSIATTTYAEYTVNLSAYSGDVYIAFVRESTPADGWYLYVDDVTVEDLPSCVPPTVNATTSIASTTATINWTAPSSAPSNGYEWEVRTSGAGGSGATGLAASGSVGAGVVMASVTGLTANTSYTVYVRSNCGGSGFSTWASGGAFNNTLGYTCALPVVVSTFPYNNSTTTCGAGNDYGTQCSGNYGGGEDFVYQLDISTMGLYTIAITGSTTYTGWFLKNSSSCATGSSCLANAVSGSGTTASGTYNFTSAGTYYLIIDHWPSPNCGTFTLNITPPPACPSPTSLSTTNVTTTTADIKWNQATSGSPAGYEWEVGTTGFVVGTGVSISNGTTASATDTIGIASGLAPNTAYQFYVRSDCGGSGFSTWAGPYAFTTPCAANTSFAYTTSYNGSSIPSCWSSSVTSGTANWSYASSSTDITTPSPSGGNFAYKPYSTSTALLISEPQDLSSFGTNQARVKFYIYKHSATVVADELKVYINTSNNLTGATLLQTFKIKNSEFPVVASSGWYQVTANIPLSFNSSTVHYIILEGKTTAGFSSYDIGVDEFVIEQLPICTGSTGVILASSSISNLQQQCAPDAGGWVYYSSATDASQLYFGINKGSSNMQGESVSITVKGSPDTIAMSSSGVNQEHQSIMMGRSWNVTVTTQPSSPVQVRFFYNPSDTSTVMTAITNLKNAVGNTALVVSPFEWFKTIGVAYDASWRSTVVGNKFPVGTFTKALSPTYGTLNGVDYVELTVSSFSGGTGGAGFGPPSPSGGVGLPVTWAGFSAKATELGNELTWMTASEQNTDYFEVEYSYDGRTYNAIPEKIKAAGYSADLRTYNYTHTDFSTYVYYRIKQVDLDSKFDYSKKIYVKRDAVNQATFEVDVYPVPMNNDNVVYVNVKSIDKSTLTIQLTDMTGKVIRYSSLEPTSDAVKQSFDMSPLTPGIYFIEVKNGQGKETIKIAR